MKKMYATVLLGIVMTIMCAGCSAKGSKIPNADVQEDIDEMENESLNRDSEKERLDSEQEGVTDHTVNQMIPKKDELNMEIQDDTKKLMEDIQDVFDTLNDEE